MITVLAAMQLGEFWTGYLIGVLNVIMLMLVSNWLWNRKQEDRNETEKELDRMQQSVDKVTAKRKHRDMFG